MIKIAIVLVFNWASLFLSAVEGPLEQVGQEADINVRWQHYWTERYGGFGSDDGELERPLVVARAVEDLRRLVDFDLPGNPLPQAIARLRDVPEHIAIEKDVRHYIKRLSELVTAPEYAHVVFPARVYRHHLEISWLVLSQWWMDFVMPTLPQDEAVELLIDTMRSDTQFPLHEAPPHPFYLTPILRANHRKQLYSVLLNEEIRPGFSVNYILLHGDPALQPSADEAAALVERDQDHLRRSAIHIFRKLYPNDRRGHRALISMMTNNFDHLLDVPILLYKYFETDLDGKIKIELFTSFLRAVEVYCRAASEQGVHDTVSALHLLNMSFIPRWLERESTPLTLESAQRLEVLLRWGYEQAQARGRPEAGVLIETIDIIQRKIEGLQGLPDNSEE